jgi:uncharacterized damage-inducible protein DinB
LTPLLLSALSIGEERDSDAERFEGNTWSLESIRRDFMKTLVGAELEGLWEGYDGEWARVSRQLVAHAEATPADKFAWRPAPGVRSTSEVYMHIALASFYLLSVTGPPMPPDITSTDMEKSVTSKADVIAFLKRSLDAVKTAHAQLKPGDLQRKVKIMNKEVTVDGVYLRILVHGNEHMGQLVGYARMTDVVPPWSEPAHQ